MRKVLAGRRWWKLFAFLAAGWALFGQAGPGSTPSDSPVDGRITERLDGLPPVRLHEAGLPAGRLATSSRAARNYRHMLGEKLEGRWFAALLSTAPGNLNAVVERFPTWKGFTEFLGEKEALVELWAPGENGLENGRRISATEVASIRRQRFEQPLLVTVTYRAQPSGQPTKYQVEFGFGAADQALAGQAAYLRQREFQEAARQILSTRNDRGQFSARAQWEALTNAVQSGRFPVLEMPGRPIADGDLFVAVEYKVDEGGYLERPLRLWSESEVQRRVVRQSKTNYTQVLMLRRFGAKSGSEVHAFRVKGTSDELEPVPSPVPGQDAVELRVRDPLETEPRKWNLLEFGEPEVVRQASLARFSLINAYLEKRRKEIALRKSKVDLIVEPLFLGLNVGAGIAGVPFPVPEAVRLGYNAFVTPLFISAVPTVQEMRQLLRLMAAKERDPVLKYVAEYYLTEEDIHALKTKGQALSEAEVAEYLDRIGDKDIRGMLYLARMHFVDQELTNILNLLTGAGKVSGWTDEEGPQRDVLNSVYFSLNGDISIKNIIAVLAGADMATPLSGVSLEELAHGDGPAAAWLQFLDFTVDVRAVANTISRIMTADPAERELEMPFPYATRMTDPAAYELRIFGFPLLMFYKRGLLKDDAAAFMNDYAYGLITTRIVEHFRTREEMDEEIRAGRMVPLGFVKVPGTRGDWKETNLAVFAHRIPRGKHQGKISIVLYGLKAYEEHSALIEREYERLKRFDQARTEGGVIEQLVWAEHRELIPGTELEPRIETGPNVSATRFAPLLGRLLENRRYARLRAWGVALSETERQDWERVVAELEAEGIAAGEGVEDPLVGVDRYNSSFMVRKKIAGQQATVKLVSIPARAEMLREMLKAEEARQVEQLRREGVSSRGNGVVLFNTVKSVDGRVEVGPLLERNGSVVGAGVQVGAEAVNRVFAQLQGLPVVERARLQHRNFASTLVPLDARGDGTREPVFVTIEFPFGKAVQQTTTNRLSGEIESLHFEDGQLRRIVSPRRITELDYTEEGFESAGRTYRNIGTLAQPLKGTLLEQTRTTDVWARDLASATLDPHEPLMGKIKASHVTGAFTREVFGLFPLPVTSADDRLVVSNRFDAMGEFVGATAYENGVEKANSDDARWKNILEPRPAQARFTLTPTQGTPGDRPPFTSVIQRADARKGVAIVQAFDNGNFGRQQSESWTDVLPGAGPVQFEVRYEYRDDFFAGLIPAASVRLSTETGTTLSRTATLSYDPLERRLTAVETDSTGAVRTNVWDYRYEAPVESETALRRTQTDFSNSYETEFFSRTRGGQSRSGGSPTSDGEGGEELITSRGAYDLARKQWQVERTLWFRAGITNRVETETRTAFGTHVSTRLEGHFESRPEYDRSGLEERIRVFRWNPQTREYDIPHRYEDDYRWEQGARSARVQTFLEGQPYDIFGIVTDTEGRLVKDGLREYRGLRLATENTYDGASERLLTSRDLQNGQVRVTRTPGPEIRQDSSRWVLPVVVTPRWGLISTQMFQLGEALARPISTTLENGESIQVREWFADSPLARVSELVGRHGKAKERHIAKPNSGSYEGTPCDSAVRYHVTFWGQTALATEETLVRGTDIPLFIDAADERTFYDLNQPLRAPRLIVDANGASGISLSIDGRRWSNLLAVCRTHVSQGGDSSATNGWRGAALVVEKADVRGLFTSQVAERHYAPSGHLLGETITKVSNLRGRRLEEDDWFTGERFLLAEFTPQYERGWLVEVTEPEVGRALAFTNQMPTAGLAGYAVNEGRFPEFATETEGKIFVTDGNLARTNLAFMPRRLRAPRLLEWNPYQPQRQDAWVQWTSVDFRADGTKLLERTVVFDGQGRPAVQKSWKRTAAGKPASRIAYFVSAPPAESLRSVELPAGEYSLSLDTLPPGGQGTARPASDGERASGETRGGESRSGASPTSTTSVRDLSSADFLCLFADRKLEGVLKLTDSKGKTVRVRPGPSNFRDGEVEPWRIHPMHVRWLPDDLAPVQGTEVNAPVWLVGSGRMLPVSVHDIARTGVDVRNVKRIELMFSNAAPARLQLSSLHLLQRSGPFIPDEDWREFYRAEYSHANGIRTMVTSDQAASARDVYAGQRMDGLVSFNGMPVATARAHALLARFPHVLWLDNGDFEVPRPMFDISDLDGHFYDLYASLRFGDAQLRVTPPPFEAPRLEVYRADVLEDELYPGFIAYGRERQLAVKPGRAKGTFTHAASLLRQRIEANGFRVAGEHLLGTRADGPHVVPALPSGDTPAVSSVDARAAQVAQQPTVSEALLAFRDLPWEAAAVTPGSAPPIDWSRVALRLSALQVPYYQTTRLIPTSPGTDAERYVDTVAEADLVTLAVNLRSAVASDLLEFFWRTSRGGDLPLLSSYDAKFGTGMKADVLDRRPRQADATAEAQLAVAEAAYQAGLANGDSKWLTLGENLLRLTLDGFRAQRVPGAARGGIAEAQVLPVRHALGSVLWPAPRYYTLRSNARAYLLLKKLKPILDQGSKDEAWKGAVTLALDEQERFLRTHFLAEVERTGVVPAGLFEIQDTESATSALGVERWTTAEDWLLFVEAAAQMGVPPDSTRQWLDNLARVHGAHVGGVWGLDWRVPVLRPDAISPALTARFVRVARLLGHRAAAQYGQGQLASMQRQGEFPVVLTEASPTRVLTAGQEFSIRPRTNHLEWPASPATFRAVRELETDAWSFAVTPTNLVTLPPQDWRERRTDLTVFILIAAGVYLSVLASAFFWWAVRAMRRRQQPEAATDRMVPESVMQLAEERWAKRVMGLRSPPAGEHWRYSNAPVEQNFLSQLRAIYKLVLQWRRLENGWAEDDPRLVQDATDPWLNGADEFAVLVGLYMRTVIKAGAKDGFSQKRKSGDEQEIDVLAENEDSNHIWARLAMYFSENLWGLAAAVSGWQRSRGGPEESDYREEILEVLESIGLRERTFAFDAGELFDYPANTSALDLLVVQAPNMTLRSVMEAAALKLDIPLEHITRVIARFKEFKQREKPYPVHPYLLEFAKELPHFALMWLGAVIWYNQAIHDSPIVPYLTSTFTGLGLSVRSLLWAVPLFAGLVLTVLTYFLRVYRYEAAIRRQKAEIFFDRSVTSLFVKRHEVEPKARTGRWRNPDLYERWAWVLRALGFTLLAAELFTLDTPSFGTFLIVKGLFGMVALAEVAGIVLPLLGNSTSMFLQDYVTRRPGTPGWVQSLNRLNITASLPASPVWLAIKYHAQPSMPTGRAHGLAQAVIFYFILAASFFFGAGYLCQQIFPLWFTDTYLQAADWKLALGGAVFLVTMVLLRYGLFIFYTAIASLLAAFPLQFVIGLVGAGQLLFALSGIDLGLDPAQFQPLSWAIAGLAVVSLLLEKPIRRWLRGNNPRPPKTEQEIAERLKAVRGNPAVRLGVVYMSGDDLSALKLTPDLLMSRWTILRDKLDSRTVPMLAELAGKPDDAALKGWFQALYDAEKKAGVTLWHPAQLALDGEGQEAGEQTAGNGVHLPPELGLRIPVPDAPTRQQLLVAWHIRRWLCSMMSTAGHSQDTAINLVDVALRLASEGLSQNTVFYLMQNKYDANTNNRPSQLAYDKGELDHRNKLARLLCAVAPGTQAWCLQDWTPFGFKSGGLSGMDLVYEESLRLNTLLLLDRNATVHDLDGLILDLEEALTDPNLIIVIPGRGTTNTLTPLGQASQLVEEGHRSFLRGLLSYLGGSASESVGTGWGNILACFYGRVQRALLAAGGRKRPVTSRMKRGTTFADRTEGLIGFGPHAVGISEDIWAVVQTMNNALGLGYRPRFALSRAIWHKIRETWSHAEWLASFPRWAGGYLQMANDPLMQRINDLGPQPVFARDIRCSAGRNFMAAPLALANILLMPLAIIFDVSPFVQMLFILWNCGFILNQVLTLHALNTYLENCGFQRALGLAGAAAGVAAGLIWPQIGTFTPGLVILGCLAGGFFVGLSRWLATRLRDLIVFGPQLVMQTMAHMVRLSLEFTVSGTSAEDAKSVNMAFRAWVGPREDRPLERFPNFINLRTVIWGIGLFSTVLCGFALMHLDLLNVLLLLPSLLFSVSTLVGPFLCIPPRGRPIGPWALLPRLLGWAVAAGVYMAGSLLIYWGGWHRWLGILLLGLVLGVVVSRALRYLMFPLKVRRLKKPLVRLLLAAGVKPAKAEGYAAQLMQMCAAEPAKVGPELERVGMKPEHIAPIVEMARGKLTPTLRAPVQHMEQGLLSRNRWAVELCRSFVLGLLALFWFFLVPVPALIVFTAGSYRFTISLDRILVLVGSAIGVALVAAAVARLVELAQLGRAEGKGLRQRLAACFARLKELPRELGDPDRASAFALLSDVQTYLDQRSHAYADAALCKTERLLKLGGAGAPESPTRLQSGHVQGGGR